jgi:hypothetical protein
MNKEETIKRQLEVLEETVQYYSEDTSRRGYEPDSALGNTCSYITPKGNMCAVGRCLQAQYLPKAAKAEGGILTLLKTVLDIPLSSNGDTDAHLDSILEDKYTGLGHTFFRHLQGLHDSNNNWNNTGLTIHGNAEVKGLKRQITRGEYLPTKLKTL